MRLHGDYELDLSFQRGCGQNIESNGVICCLHLFSLGYKPTVGRKGLGSQGESDSLKPIPEMERANGSSDRGLVSAASAPRFKKRNVGHPNLTWATCQVVS